MNWEQIRQQHPNKWVVVEAIDAQSINNQRVINDLVVIGVYDRWERAWEAYKQVHHADKWREYYCLSTERKNLDIGLMDTFGRIA